jgi:hypothetical protein
MKVSLEEMETAVGVFEDRLDKMDTTDVEANTEGKKTIAEQQEVHNEEAAVEMIRGLKDRSGDGRLAARRCRRLTPEVIKDRRSRRDVGRARNATTA